MRFQFNDGGRARPVTKGRPATAHVELLPSLRNCHTKCLRSARRAHLKPMHHQTSTEAWIGQDWHIQSTIRRVLESLAWQWTPTMTIGSGCQVHLREGELPSGRLMVQVSKHVVAVIDGVIHDMDDWPRDGMPYVYGDWRKHRS